jgi:hypothetical protein
MARVAVGYRHQRTTPIRERVRAMTNKRIRLPREGIVGPEDARGVGPGEARFVDETDVEGHGWVNPAPPVDFSKGSPSQGGELVPSEGSDKPGPNDLR